MEALEVGLGAIATIASAIEDWAERIGQPTHAPGFLPPDAGVAPYLDAFEAHPPARGRTRSRAPVLRAAPPPGLQVDGEALPNAYRKAMVGGTKEQRERACVDLQARVVEEVVGAQRREAAAAEAAAARDDEEAEGEGEEGEGPSTAGKGEDEVLLASASFEEAEIRGALKKMACEAMREIVAATGERTDGRSTTQVRPISVEIAPLPPVVHGSALFTRGETQALGTTTLGDSSMAQRYEDLEGEREQRRSRERPASWPHLLEGEKRRRLSLQPAACLLASSVSLPQARRGSASTCSTPSRPSRWERLAGSARPAGADHHSSFF